MRARLSWPGWRVTYRGCMPVHRWLLIPVLTGLKIELTLLIRPAPFPVCQTAIGPHVGLGQSPLIPSLPHFLLLSFSIFYFSCFPILTCFICFLAFPFLFHSTRIVPLPFQARCHKRRLDLALFFILILCYMYF